MRLDPKFFHVKKKMKELERLLSYSFSNMTTSQKIPQATQLPQKKI
jgi:hypothetical protein